MNGHVRVDVLYRRFTRHQQARVDLLGGVFLLVPMMGFILYSSWDYVMLSWQIGEGSNESGALNAIYVLKTAILIMPLLVLLQWLASLPDLLLAMRAEDSAHPQAQGQPMNTQERM
jgi:TRAP-type mannitol/chloroaromatic compound transport system permease small subunit